MKFRLSLVLLLVIGLFSQANAALPPEIKEKIYNVLRDPALENSRVGIRVEVLGTRKEVFSYNPRIPLIPASNLKILTTSCALLTLGPEYHFTTTLLGNPIQNGHLQGNLVLRGSGDPTWSKDFYPDPTTPLVTLARKLKESGLQTVDGDLVVDDSTFGREFTGEGWKVRYQWEEYAAEIAALSLNKNEVKVTVVPGGHVGAPTQVSFWPKNHLLQVINHSFTSGHGSALSYSRNRLKNQIVLSGPLSIYNRGISFPFNVHAPPLLVGSAFLETLKSHGIEVKGRVRTIRDDEIGKDLKLQTLMQVNSPPLLSIVHRLNKESDNFLAEHVFRTLGATDFGKGTIRNSAKAVTNCLDEFGLKESPVVLADGSGLSDQNRVSPQTLVSVLQAMAGSPLGESFRATLPQACQDGTLDERLCGVSAQAKTGAIRGVNSLSGYVVTNSGQTLVFSIILNRYSCSSECGRQLIDTIIRALAQSEEAL